MTRSAAAASGVVGSGTATAATQHDASAATRRSGREQEEDEPAPSPPSPSSNNSVDANSHACCVCGLAQIEGTSPVACATCRRLYHRRCGNPPADSSASAETADAAVGAAAADADAGVRTRFGRVSTNPARLSDTSAAAAGGASSSEWYCGLCVGAFASMTGLLQAAETSDFCLVCKIGGDLLVCDTCPLGFHLECLGLDALPEGDWR